MLRTYISAPITSGDDKEKMRENCLKGVALAKRFMSPEKSVFCPHAFALHLLDETLEGSLTHKQLLDMDTAWLHMAHYAVFGRGWQHSKGCRVEHSYAKIHHLQCWYEREDGSFGTREEESASPGV